MSPCSLHVIRRLIAALAALWIAAGTAVLPAAAAEPARLTLQAGRGPEGAVRLTAAVLDAQGAPVVGVPVAFKARATFGWLALGEVSTDRDGRAQINLPAASRSSEVSAEAGDEGQVRATLRLDGGKPVQPRVRPGRDVLSEMSPQPGFISPYPVPMQVTILTVILGGIWTTYGYVGWLLSRIRSGH